MIIPNVENQPMRMEYLMKIYKPHLKEENKNVKAWEFHHIFAKSRVNNICEGLSKKYNDDYAIWLLYRDSFLNTYPLPKPHYTGGSYKFKDRQVEGMIEWLKSHPKEANQLNFNASENTLIELARIVFEYIEFVPYWFTELY